MLGWEFPPFISGGLGTACYGLTKAMNNLGLKIIFCLPAADFEEALQNHDNSEVRKLRWKDSATKCVWIYKETLAAA